jgi:ribosomal protein S18 acetylase RimI-like enzyme
MVAMKKQKKASFSEDIAITQLNRKFTADLMKHRDYFFSARQRGDVLNHGFRYEALKAIKLIPRATRLVAYQMEEKEAIGFLYLEENTDWLYTIEYVFVDPRYRKMGLATRLINYALKIAKEKGARKVNLNVDSKKTNAINLYRRLGFKKIGCTLLVQGYLSGPRISRLIKQFVAGQGCLTKLAIERKGNLLELETNFRKNKEILFGICQSLIGQDWKDFFEISANNLTKGSRHVWQPPFFKDVLINNLANSFALVFHSPFSSKATIELYAASKALLPSMVEELLKILANMGISFAQITLFNYSYNMLGRWFEEKKMMTFQFVTMGKTL